MPNKLRFEYIKDFINKEELLISTEYINSKTLLEIKCNICKENYEQIFSRYKNGHRHQKCTYNKIENCSINGLASARKKYGVFLKETIRICEWCKKEYNPKRREQKLCSRVCSNSFINKDK